MSTNKELKNTSFLKNGGNGLKSSNVFLPDCSLFLVLLQYLTFLKIQTRNTFLTIKI